MHVKYARVVKKNTYIVCKLYPSIISYVFIQSLFAIYLQGKNKHKTQLYVYVFARSVCGWDHYKGGSRILKWEVNFCNNVREIKYYFNI